MQILRPNTSEKNLYENVLAALSLIIIWSAFIYYLYALNLLGLIISLSGASLSFFIWRRPNWPQLKNWPPLIRTSLLDLRDRKSIIWLTGYFILAGSLLTLAIYTRSDQALISPWEKVSAPFFILYGLSVIWLTLAFSSQTLANGYKTLLLSIHYLISFSLAAIVYKIGYGFDPFIHESAMEFIAERGLILPKTPYYLGQYGLVMTLNQLTALPIAWLNAWLVPALSALLLPYALTHYCPPSETIGPPNSNRWLMALLLPVLTFSPLIVTTPQNLSYLFLGLAVIISLRKDRLALVSALALSATAIHPLTGLPALAWCTFLLLERYRSYVSAYLFKGVSVIIYTLAILGLPLALVLGGGAKFVSSLSTYWSQLFSSLHGFSLAGQEDIILNFNYFFASNLSWFLFIVTASLIIYSWHRGFRPKAILKILSALSLAYLISRGLEFGALIDYEQADYAKRIPIIMLIFALPFWLAAGYRLIEKIRERPRAEQLAWLTFFTSLALISLYTSYPRFDHYFNSRGYSTSAADIEAVNTISQDTNEPYIVLANQQVSAAALREIGFDNYHPSLSGPIYTYAIPTGGALYKYYLDMVYEQPKRETMKNAAELASVKVAYLVINKYWYQSGQIINAAKLSADKWWSVKDEVYIFRYNF